MIKCKGRNGYFDYAGFDVVVQGDEVHIGIYSKKKGKADPIWLNGDMNEIFPLLTDIQLEVVKKYRKAKDSKTGVA